MVNQPNNTLNLFWAFSLSAFLALVLMILQVNQILVFWPEWMALVIIYWALMVPDRIGPLVGFITGTLLDVLLVRNFGVLGFGLASLAFVVNRTHLQLRVLSLWQQTVVIGLFIGIFKLITGWLYGLTSDLTLSAAYFYPSLGSMLMWPFAFILLQELRRKARIA
ncbi:MAG: rod shape-determining protein MreD [Gammaproteobacteria bacterium]|nr:rod shape-determining protein MreD [Gammaproteobacteria bacterium]